MSEFKNVDASKTIINHHDDPSLPPPKMEVGVAGWARKNLFGSPSDAFVTIVTSLIALVLVGGLVNWAVGSANWFAVINNQRLFMMERFEPLFEWRLALIVLLAALLTGVSLAALARRSARSLGIIALTIVVFVTVLPDIIEAAIPQPNSYLTAGNVEIIDRASTLTPQKDLGFIAQAGEQVSVSLALDEVADLDTLSNLSGFSDRVSNALANAARNRHDQQEKAGAAFTRMISGELTESLEERVRLDIRTFTRTNDMLASTNGYVNHIGARLTGADGLVGELRYWLERLDRAATGLDPRETAILAAVEAADDTITNLSINDAPPPAVHEAIVHLTTTIEASEQLEQLGALLVLQLSEDLIGEPDQSDDDEDLITPSEREADFLRDMFIRLLTPQSVLTLYELGQTPMYVAIRDASTKDVLVDGMLNSASDNVSYEIPRDGWYVLTKDAAEGEQGSAILAVKGVHPIVERTRSATESFFVRLTDNDLVITDNRPQYDDEENIPFIVLLDNQYRGLRDLETYLIHFVPPFFRQLEALLLPFVMTVAWGFILGRALAHILGANSLFNINNSRAVVLAWSMTPLLVLLAYFILLDRPNAITGLPAEILKIVAVLGAMLLAQRGEKWLNQTNSGEDAEGPINRLLIYGWGIYPFIMYVLASGVGGLSGATLGSMTGGLIWLLVMYFVGLNYEGMLGYALLVGGFFLQIVQSAVVNSVWDGWTMEPLSGVLIWLVLAIIGVSAGTFGASLKQSIELRVKRAGYLISCIAFLFVFVNTNMVADGADMSAPLLAGVAIALWLGWMFFAGSHQWYSNRIIIGLLLLTFLWMGSWTGVDRWSTLYFTFWLMVGAIAFKRGEGAQAVKRLAKGSDKGRIFYRFPLHALLAVAAAWLLALLLLPSLIVGLDTLGILQTSPQELLPISDKRLWGGLMLTMQLTILGIGASFPIGLALALGRRSSMPAVKYACILYIEVVRGVPLITVLFLATLLVPLVDPTLATIENAVRAWVGITMFSAAYLAENVRGGLQSIDRGQTEAAQAIGLSGWQTTIHILLPQALRAVIPALVGQFISLFKDTSLVYIVGLAEITGIAQRVVAQSEFLQRREETFLYVAMIYFVFSYMMSYISRRVEATGSGAVRAEQI